MARKGGKAKKKEQIRSKKKVNKNGHELNKLQFKSRANEKMYDKLAIEYLENHLPKIMNIVPSNVREKRGEDFRKPGKLFDENIRSIETKNTYVKRVKTFIKWHVIEKGIGSLGEITKESTEEFFGVMENNIGQEKGKYSKKTYDSYVDGVYKYFESVAKAPEDAVTRIEGRTFGKPIKSAERLHRRDFKQKIRDKVPDYSAADYKRGKKGGYSVRDANVIMRQAEKHLGLKEQLLVATLVYGGARVDETLNFSMDCYDTENQRNKMLKPYMNKHNRPRVVLDTDKKLVDIAERFRKESGVSETEEIFKEYSSDNVRGMIKNLCEKGKIGYSGVHDLRKSYVSRIERDMFKDIGQGRLTKEDLVQKLMAQAGEDPRLNPLVPQKEWVKKDNGGGYWRNKKVNGQKVEERKYSYEKLRKMNIENLCDLYVAENIGHSDVQTNNEYRSEEAKQRRKEFRDWCKEERKKGKLR